MPLATTAIRAEAARCLASKRHYKHASDRLSAAVIVQGLTWKSSLLRAMEFSNVLGLEKLGAVSKQPMELVHEVELASAAISAHNRTTITR